jgi:hypothetical protein
MAERAVAARFTATAAFRFGQIRDLTTAAGDFRMDVL